ncbi:hypothetical protein LIER_33525 [Lithospermum erythrorhizon]|uniref:Uncharacterized protein n=1 Tax=Lithospermum erythrorhizon TaxID=34254 RepID=A0AAV3S118_LITER
MHQFHNSLSKLHGMIMLRKERAMIMFVKHIMTTPTRASRRDAMRNDKCHHCGIMEYWMRNCKKYLIEKKNCKSTILPAGIYVVTLETSYYDTWLLHTRSCTHICRNVQNLQNKRQPEKGEMDLQVDNGSKDVSMCAGM